MKKDVKSPATTSVAYDEMSPVWNKIRTVLAGTKAMREAGHLYLPQHENETDTAYGERLNRNTLFNLTQLTLDSWVGRPFSDPIQFDDSVPEEINALLDDIDLVGNDIHSFCRTWFADGLAKAYSHVLVEFPRAPVLKSKAEENEENLRPYWVHIQPEQLFFADVEVVKGKETLREIRFWENLNVRDGFAEVTIPQIRRMFVEDDVCRVELYQQKKVKGKEAWSIVDRYDTTLSFIPLVTFYADRKGPLLGKSPVEDLADLNISHWQSSSDQRAVLTVARFPILACSGGSDETKIVIGPNRFLYCPDPAGRFYYVEHSGAAIGAGRQDLQDLEMQMSEYGAEFLKKRPGVVTATARALDSAEATSALQEVTRRFADALSLALQYTAEWLRLASGGTATLTTDFGPEVSDSGELATLTATRAGKDISREAFLEELKRRAILMDEFDIEADALQLETEAMNAFGGEMPVVQPPVPGEEQVEKAE